MSAEQAAKYLVVGWCKRWSLMLYVETILGRKVGVIGDWDAFADEVRRAYPWMPVNAHHYTRDVREYVGGMWPKLSAWLFSRKDDASRLGCAGEVQKLRAKARAAKVGDEDRKEMKIAGRDGRIAAASYRMSRDAFKTNQRSAWNVCKA